MALRKSRPAPARKTTPRRSSPSYPFEVKKIIGRMTVPRADGTLQMGSPGDYLLTWKDGSQDVRTKAWVEANIGDPGDCCEVGGTVDKGPCVPTHIQVI